MRARTGGAGSLILAAALLVAGCGNPKFGEACATVAAALCARAGVCQILAGTEAQCRVDFEATCCDENDCDAEGVFTQEELDACEAAYATHPCDQLDALPAACAGL